MSDEAMTQPSNRKPTTSVNLDASIENTTHNSHKKDPLFEGYFYEGKKYYSVRSIAFAYDVSPSPIYANLRKGMSIKEAVDTAIQRQRKNRYTYNGKNYTSLKAMCDANNVSAYSVRYYCEKHNKTYNQAIRVLKAKKTKREKRLENLRKKYFPEDTDNTEKE